MDEDLDFFNKEPNYDDFGLKIPDGVDLAELMSQNIMSQNINYGST